MTRRRPRPPTSAPPLSSSSISAPEARRKRPPGANRRTRKDTDMAHAIRFHKTGGPEVLVWESVEVGKPGPGQVKLRQTAVGLNFVDTYFRAGGYPTPLPSGVGTEAAGIAEEVGPGVTEVKPGDRVAYAGRPARPH